MFNPGDKVLIHPLTASLFAGKTGTVVSADQWTSCVRVEREPEWISEAIAQTEGARLTREYLFGNSVLALVTVRPAPPGDAGY